MDTFTWILIGVMAISVIGYLISNWSKRIPCSKCRKKGIAQECEYEDCDKVYCSNCSKTL